MERLLYFQKTSQGCRTVFDFLKNEDELDSGKVEPYSWPAGTASGRVEIDFANGRPFVVTTSCIRAFATRLRVHQISPYA